MTSGRERTALYLCVLLFTVLAMCAGTAAAQSPPSDAKAFQTHALQPLPAGSLRLKAEALGALSEPGTVAPSSVIGADERWRITPTTGFPARAIAYLALVDSDGYETGYCTGTFIGPDAVLTAGHCLYDSTNGWAYAIAVVPGRDGATFPYGWQYASNASVPGSWYSSQDPNADWGLISMPSQTLGNTVGWLTLGVRTTLTLSGTNLAPIIAGYPGDKPQGTQWAGSKPALYGVQPYALQHLIDTYSGQSGAAVRRSSDNMVVGVHVRGSPSLNEATRVTQQFLDTALGMCTTMGCTFSYYVEPILAPTGFLPLVGHNRAY